MPVMTVQLPPYRPIRRRSGIKVMFAAIHALFMRELQTRFGSYRLGYLWAPLEVMLQMLIYLLVFGAVMNRVLPGMDYSLFLLAGIVPFYMFQRIVSRSMGAVEANRGLLMYRSVRHIDVIIARSFLELVIYFFTFWLLLLVTCLIKNLTISFEQLEVVLYCWTTLFLFSLGSALIMMMIGHYGGEMTKIVSIVFTMLYFLSGVMYSIHVVPEPYFSYLLYNPIIHNLELIRHAISPAYTVHHIDFSYFLKWMLAVDFLGLLLYKALEKDLIRKR